MNWLSRIQSQVLALFGKRKLDREMNEEMRAHIEMRTQANIDAGMEPHEAQYAALREFGWAETIKETCRDQRGVGWIEAFFQDARHGLRQMQRNPGFTAVAVLTLALGVGSCTAIFSLVNAALLKALPYRDSDRLVVVWSDNPGLKLGVSQLPPANSDIATWRQGTQTFGSVSAFSPRSADLSDGGDAERLGAAGVTAGFFETLGVTPSLGRTFVANEDAPGGPRVAMISHGLWKRRFGGDPGLLGKPITINGERHTVIGVLPPEFDFPRGSEWPAYMPFSGQTEIWLPLALRDHSDGSGWSNWESRDERSLAVIGRLNPGIGLSEAQAEMNAFSAREAKDHSDSHKGWRLKVVPLREQLAGKNQTALLMLFAAVGLLLFIACVNVANLLLARGTARRQEIAVRAALGAGRGRVIWQLLTENVLLAAIGSGFGLLVAQGCLKAFIVLNPITRSRLDEASLNPAALGFAALVTLVTSAVFGLLPALQASRCDLRKSIQESGRGGGGASRERAGAWLVAAEVALALVLLTTAGLMARSFLRVLAVQPGFRADSVLAFDLDPPGSRYSSDSAKIAFFKQLTERLQGLPGTGMVGAISCLPLSGGDNLGNFVIEGEPPVHPGNEPIAERRWVTPGYFAAMGIPIRRGRVFAPQDSAGQPNLAVINESLARQFFKSHEVLGSRLRINGSVRTIVGVVSDVKSASLEGPVRFQVYIPYAQDPWSPMTVVLRASGDPLLLASAARGELKQIDPALPAAKMRTLEQVISDATSARRFNMALLAFFAGAALLLTMIGIYGVVAFLVGRRRREIGVRMALGAQRRDVLRLILREGMRPVLFGAVAGSLGSLAASRLIASQLYGISTSDPLTFAAIISFLMIAALLACWLPARRAARLCPTMALRHE